MDAKSSELSDFLRALSDPPKSREFTRFSSFTSFLLQGRSLKGTWGLFNVVLIFQPSAPLYILFLLLRFALGFGAFEHFVTDIMNECFSWTSVSRIFVLPFDVFSWFY